MKISPTGYYEWVVPNFAGFTETLESPTFEIGGYSWRLRFFPKSTDSTDKEGHVSLFLNQVAATCPSERQHYPDTIFALKVKNFKDRKLDHADCTDYTFGLITDTKGFPQYIQRDKLTADSGFLTSDGSVVLQLELEVQNPKPPSWYSEQAVLAADVLSLLDDPDGTSDLTVIVGGGNGSAAAGGNASSGSGGAGGIGEAAAPGGSSLPRSFRVHRAVLAARCPYFRTLFDVGMADSAARELRLPDADPDAFAALLRCMYGGEVLQCERAVHCAAIQLCDMLLLPTIKDALREVLVECADASTIIGDLLWAAQAGQEEILEELLGVYKRVGKDVDPEGVATLVAASQPLAARLIVELTMSSEDESSEDEPVPRMGWGPGFLYRARTYRR